MLSSYGSQGEDDPFTRILFVPPQLSGRPQTPSSSAAPRGTPAPGGRLSAGRTPSRRPQSPPLNTAMETPFDAGTPFEGRRQHEDSVPPGDLGLQWDIPEEPPVIPGEPGMLRGRRQAEYKDTWVTLFGFPSEDLPAVLREFMSCGDIVKCDTSEKGPAGNWVHVQFRTQEGAERALQKNGMNINGNLIVGVQPPSLRTKAILQDLMEREAGVAEEIQEEDVFHPVLSSPSPLQTTGQPTPARGPLSASGHRTGSARRLPVQESDMPQPSWRWLRPIGVWFGL